MNEARVFFSSNHIACMIKFKFAPKIGCLICDKECRRAHNTHIIDNMDQGFEMIFQNKQKNG